MNRPLRFSRVGPRLTTNWFSAGDRTGITAGTRTIGTYNVENTLVGNSSFDSESGLQLDAWMKSDLDNKGRPQRTDYPLDGTYSISQYSCCGIGFSRDRSGATQNFSRDPLKRVYMVASRRSSAGPQLLTTTNPDGSTEIRSSFADGQPASSSGTAVVQMTYDPIDFHPAARCGANSA